MALISRLWSSVGLTNRRIYVTTTPRTFHTGLYRRSQQRSLSSIKDARVAVLYQALKPPIINGVRKPLKPGGKSLLTTSLINMLIHSQQDIKILELTSLSRWRMSWKFNSSPQSRLQIRLTRTAGVFQTLSWVFCLLSRRVLPTSGQILLYSLHIPCKYRWS